MRAQKRLMKAVGHQKLIPFNFTPFPSYWSLYQSLKPRAIWRQSSKNALRDLHSDSAAFALRVVLKAEGMQLRSSKRLSRVAAFKGGPRKHTHAFRYHLNNKSNRFAFAFHSAVCVIRIMWRDWGMSMLVSYPLRIDPHFYHSCSRGNRSTFKLFSINSFVRSKLQICTLHMTSNTQKKNI